MLSRKPCKVCNKSKVHIKDSEPLKKGYKYRDLSRRVWNGRTCPDCYRILKSKNFKGKHEGKPCFICKTPLPKGKQKYCSKKCSRKAEAPSRKEYRQRSESDKKARREAKRLRKRTCRQRKLKCVSWSEIAEVYDNTPEGHDVDHIIPLNGSLVSGLHVPWNFQYLTKDDNNRKLARFDGTYENEGWRH